MDMNDDQRMHVQLHAMFDTEWQKNFMRHHDDILTGTWTSGDEAADEAFIAGYKMGPRLFIAAAMVCAAQHDDPAALDYVSELFEHWTMHMHDVDVEGLLR